MQATLPLPGIPAPRSGSMPGRILGRGARQERYILRLADREADVRAAQTLRFIVFNVEMNEGLDDSFATCLDADEFDAVCDHLLVEDKETGEVVGTYRLQTGSRARANLDYYSAQEFDLAPFEARRERMLELGRACVHSQHRNLAVLGLLWQGIVRYARQRDAVYLLGCSSIPTVEPEAGAAIYEKLRCGHLAPPEWRTSPLAHMACPLNAARTAPVRIPKLLSAYLALGAVICGPPALDWRFKTIDFLTLLNLEDASARVWQQHLLTDATPARS